MLLPTGKSRLLAGAFAFALGLVLAADAAAQTLVPVPGAPTLNTVTFSWTAGTPPYWISLSTDSSFAVWETSGSFSGTTTTYINLDQDTIYNFRVKNSAQDDGSYEQTQSVTLAAAPSGPFFQGGEGYFTAESSVTAQVSVAWETNGNPDYTEYVLEYTSHTDFTSYKGSIALPHPPLTASGLLANTTYLFRVKASNLEDVETIYSGIISTSTLAAGLQDVSHSVHRTSAAVSWTPMASGIRERNAEGYALLMATSPVFSGVVHSSATADAAAGELTIEGLLMNTTYYYKAGALNWNGVPNYTYVKSFTTRSSSISAFGLVSRHVSSASFSWDALAGGAAGYELQASTSAAFGLDPGALVLSSRTFDLAWNSLSMEGLRANTTWYFRAGSLNSALEGNYAAPVSTITLAELVELSETVTPNVTVGQTSIVVHYMLHDCRGYVLERSTGPFGSGAEVHFTSAPAPSGGSLGFDSLRQSTTYYLRIAALNWDFTPNYSDLGYRATLAADPLPLVTLYRVWSTSATMTFGPVGADGYAVQASTYFSFTHIAAESFEPDGDAGSATVEGLDPNTFYYFRAGPVFSGTTVYTLSTPSDDYTLPQAAAGVKFSGVFYSSAAVTWVALPPEPPPDSAWGYSLEASLQPGFDSIAFSSGTAEISVSTLALTGLAPNTSYYFRLGTLAFDGDKRFSVPGSTVTRAIPPVQEEFSFLSTGTLTVNWTAGDNPPDTLYRVVSTTAPDWQNPDGAPVASSDTYNLALSTSGLFPNTTYFFWVTAFNRLGIQEGPYAFEPMATLAFLPAAATPSGIGKSSVTINWDRDLNPPPPDTEYTVRISTRPDFASAVRSSTTRETSAWFDGLISNASYYAQVAALNHTGVPTDFATLPAPLTLPATPQALAQDAAFSGLKLDAFSVHWEDGDNQYGTSYAVEVSTTEDFSVLYSSGVADGTTDLYFTGLLIGATYWTRAQAISRDGVQRSSFTLTGSTVTLADRKGTAPYGVDTTVSLATYYGDYTVIVPAGGLSGSTRLTISPAASLPEGPSNAGTLLPTGIGLEVSHFPPVTVLEAVTLEVPYRVEDLPAGTDRSRLVLALYDPVSGGWVPLPSVSDTAANIVRAQTWHLSTFQIMISLPGSGTTGLKIYPNPYRPSSRAGVMRFAGLPAGTGIKIYTVLGELVRELRTGQDGTASWDGRNERNGEVASGVYLAFVKPPDAGGKLFKVAVER